MITTANEIRDSVIKNKIHRLIIHDCAVCGCGVGYYFFHYPHEVVFDSSCGCTSYSHPGEERSWDDVASHINRQSNKEYIQELLNQLKIEKTV